MPLLFSYGSLQLEDVQLATFGRRLEGRRDELLGAKRSSVPIADPEMIETLGKTHHDNVTFDPGDEGGVAGTVFEITESELASADVYEAAFAFTRTSVVLASGSTAWVYMHVPGSADVSAA